jgi:endoglucanase
MDEIGFIVHHIDENGFIHFYPLGGFDPKTLTAQRVLVHGKKDLLGVMGVKPIHIMTTAEERNKPLQLSDFFIDLGLSKGEVTKYVRVGDPITRERTTEWVGECLSGKSMDNRISVYALLEALRCLPTPAYDLYAAFTVQEEVGIRGAALSARQVDPDFAIAMDVTLAYDQPGAKPEERNTALGKGVGIKMLDARSICDPRMVRYLQQVAESNSIPWQPDIKDVGGTDTEALQRSGQRGAIAGAVSIPTRYIHQVVETIHPNDVAATIDLVVASLQSMHIHDWTRR